MSVISAIGETLGDFVAATGAMFFGRHLLTPQGGEKGEKSGKEQQHKDMDDERKFFKAMQELRKKIPAKQYELVFEFFEYLQRTKGALDFVRLRETLSLEPDNWWSTLLEMLKTIGLLPDTIELQQEETRQQPVLLYDQFEKPIPLLPKIEERPAAGDNNEEIFKEAARRLSVLLMQKLRLILTSPIRKLQEHNANADEEWADFWNKL